MKKKYEFTFRVEENDNNLMVLQHLVADLKNQYSSGRNVIFTEILSMPSLYYYVSITFYNDSDIKDFIIKNAETKGFQNNDSNIKGLNYEYHAFNEYTREEEVTAEYFVVVELTSEITSKSLKDEYGKYLDEEYGTKFTYNENSCKTCSFGRIQNSNLHIDYNDLKKFNIFKFGTHILLKENLKNKFVAQNFTGVEYQLVNDYKNRNMECKYYQIVITNTLPKMSDQTYIFSRTTNASCKACSNGTNVLKTNVMYDRTSLSNALDFNRTMELLGGNYENYWVISRRVKEFLETLDEKEDIFCEPIEVTEHSKQ
jgi:hypothetical protein